MPYERPEIQQMKGYLPGEQPGESGVIKLNTNENPYPASPKVAAALGAIRVEDLRRYPSPSADAFRQAAAAYHGLGVENFLPTNGGDELLRLAITTFAGSGDTIGIARPGYSLYPVLAAIQGCTVAIVDLEQDWSLPLNFAERLNAAGARLAMIVNPHAPSGVLLSADAVVEVAEHFNGVLLVDEAYVDFVDPQQNHNLVPRIRDLDNLLLLRTLSKGFSLAGLRFGYGIGSPAVIEPMLTKTRDSYNTDYISQQLAAAAIASVDYGRQIWKQVRKERRRLKDKLEQMGFACPPSQSNFLLATVPPDRDAAALYEMLKQHRILVRYFDQERLRDKLRISVGSAEENQALLRALEISLS